MNLVLGIKGISVCSQSELNGVSVEIKKFHSFMFYGKEQYSDESKNNRSEIKLLKFLVHQRGGLILYCSILVGSKKETVMLDIFLLRIKRVN